MEHEERDEPSDVVCTWVKENQSGVASFAAEVKGQVAAAVMTEQGSSSNDRTRQQALQHRKRDVTDTCVDPRAVVIEASDAQVTCPAVLGARRPIII